MTLCGNYPSRIPSEHGYAMAGLLVAIAIMEILMTLVLPYWQAAARRQKEAELIFRGEQYVRAIELYQRQFPGAYPTNFDTLVEQRFLRRAYTDPMTGEPFEILTQGNVGMPPPQPNSSQGITSGNQSTFAAGIPQQNQRNTQDDGPSRLNSTGTSSILGDLGIIGVASRSSEHSLRSYNERTRYNEWLFVYLPQATQPEAPQPDGNTENSENRFTRASRRFSVSNGETDNATEANIAR